MRSTLVLVAMAVAPSHARADPSDIVSRPLVLDEHQVAGDLVAEINLAPNQLARPLSLAPDVWFGATAQLTIGIIHSNPSVDRFLPGASFCVRHQDIGCHTYYHGSGLDVRWSARSGPFAVAPRFRALVRELDPFKPAVTLGALLRWTAGRYAITGDPYLQLGVANTDKGNRAALFLPVTFAMQPTGRWQLALRTGWYSDIAVVRDGWHVPVAIEVRARATSHIDVAAMLAFASLLGPQNTAKERTLFLTLGWR